jgi:hypothetical protein
MKSKASEGSQSDSIGNKITNAGNGERKRRGQTRVLSTDTLPYLI